MLRKIWARDFVLIREAAIPFTPGLNIITGETGSGKSILVQAISAVKGDALDRSCIRTGSEKALIEAVLDLSGSPRVVAVLANEGIVCDAPEEVLMRREIVQKGRQRFLINDQAVSRSVFQEMGSLIFDVNSQHESQQLLQEKYHLQLLDTSLGLSGYLQTFGACYQALLVADQAVHQYRAQAERACERERLIRFELQEIDGAELRTGEKEALVQEQQRLKHAEVIRRDLLDAYARLTGGEASIRRDMEVVYRDLQRVTQRDSSLRHLLEQAEALLVMADDLADGARRVSEKITDDPKRLQYVMERLHTLQAMEAKYSTDVDGIIEYRMEIERELSAFRDITAKIEQAETRWRSVFQDYCEQDRILSNMRRERSAGLCEKVMADLAALGMKHALFEASFEPQWTPLTPVPGEIPQEVTDTGSDRMRFLLSANPGEPPKPLARVASGGELSRIMLALKQHLTSSEYSGTIVFDEIDAGIGGKTATAVAGQLGRLARSKQLLCVTHLAQIAVQADHHIQVMKETDGHETRISFGVIDDSARQREIARMLAGSTTDPAALDHARVLLENTGRS